MMSLYKTMRRSATYQGLAVMLSVALPLGAVNMGCAAEVGEGIDLPENEEKQALRVRISSTLGDTAFELDLKLADDGDRLVGTRTLFASDGTSESEAIETSLAELEATAPSQSPEGSVTPPGMEGTALELVESQSLANGSLYTYRAPDGSLVHVDIEGERAYALPAVVVLAVIGFYFAVALCGIFVAWSIRTCANRGKCWSFSSWTAVCSGSCHSC